MAAAQDLPKDFKAALHRQLILENLDLTKCLEEKQTCHDRTTLLMAAAMCAAGNEEDREDVVEIEKPSAPMMDRLTKEISELHDTLLNHQLVKQSFQQAFHIVQIQEAASKNLAQVNLTDYVEQFPLEGALIANMGKNAKVNSELAGVLEDKRQLDVEILQLRIQYLRLVTSIRNQWEDLGRYCPKISVQDQPKHNMLVQKLQVREGKLRMLVSMIEHLVSSSGIHWAKNPYYVKLLELCDKIKRAPKAVQDQTMKELLDLRINHISEIKQQYVTSTPQRKENILERKIH